MNQDTEESDEQRYVDEIMVAIGDHAIANQTAASFELCAALHRLYQAGHPISSHAPYHEGYAFYDAWNKMRARIVEAELSELQGQVVKLKAINDRQRKMIPFAEWACIDGSCPMASKCDRDEEDYASEHCQELIKEWTEGLMPNLK